MDTYISEQTYYRLTAALAVIEPCEWSGKVEHYQVVDVLMAFEIWPASIDPKKNSDCLLQM